MTKALTRKQLDDPKRWAIFDRWHNAQLWGVLNGVFDLKEDKKVMDAFYANDLTFVKKITEKRIAKVGKGKPKFKKLPAKKVGYAAVTVKGSKAYAGALLNEKVFGKPKPEKKKPKKKVTAKTKVPVKVKAPHKNPENPPDPSLPQNNAYIQARKKATKDFQLRYIYLKKFPLDYVAIYYDKKKKKKVEKKITAQLPPVDEQVEERKDRYANRVAMYHAIKDSIRVEDKPVKIKKKSSRM